MTNREFTIAENERTRIFFRLKGLQAKLVNLKSEQERINNLYLKDKENAKDSDLLIAALLNAQLATRFEDIRAEAEALIPIYKELTEILRIKNKAYSGS